jgi:hypothetical protein
LLKKYIGIINQDKINKIEDQICESKVLEKKYNFEEEFKKSKEKAIKDFKDLKNIINDFNIADMIAKLSLSVYLCEEELNKENNYKRELERKVEFITGFIIRNSRIENCNVENCPENIIKLENLIDDYFTSIIRCSIFEFNFLNQNKSFDKTDIILQKAKISSFWIRNDAFSHQLIQFAQEYYSLYDSWFLDNLGFTILDVINFYEIIKNLYKARLNEYHTKILDKAKELVKQKEFKGESRKGKEYEKSVQFYYFNIMMHNAVNILIFNEDDICEKMSISKEKCQNIFSRLSQTIGYKNPYFPNSFSDPLTLPWDYNTLFEKPILKFSKGYLVPLMFIFPTVLFDTFHFDILQDNNYKANYDSKRGEWLEKKTANLLKNVFPTDKVFLNPKYPNGEEICDVLVLYDRNILIFQCKSKKLTMEAKIGKDIKKIKSDLTKSIRNSYNQGLRAKKYFNSRDYPKIILGNRGITIDMKQVDSRNIFLISVTLGQFANITTRLMNIEPQLNLFSGTKEFPWAVCIFDLEIITEILDKPYYFIHYMLKRLAIEKTDFELITDEIDLLNFYLDKRLLFENDLFKKQDEIFQIVDLTNYSKEVDEYLISKYQLGEKPIKPRVNISKRAERLTKEIDKLDFMYKNQIIFSLLDLTKEEHKYLIYRIDEITVKARNDSKIKIFSVSIKRLNLNIMYLIMDCKKDINRLFKNVEAYSIMTKYQAKTDEVIGIGSDLNTNNLVDTSYYSYYEWFKDPIQEKHCKKYLKSITFEVNK